MFTCKPMVSMRAKMRLKPKRIMRNKKEREKIKMSRGRPKTRKDVWRTKIEVDEETWNLLRSLKKSSESYNDIIKRILQGDVFVYFDFLYIDDESPENHTAIFKLGDFYYKYERGKFYSVGPNDIPRILRRGKELWLER